MFPVSSKRQSERVDLPWSMWAITLKLRIRSWGMEAIPSPSGPTVKEMEEEKDEANKRTTSLGMERGSYEIFDAGMGGNFYYVSVVVYTHPQ